MGNHRFRLSDMIPNAWFYKLRDMGRLKNHKISDPTNKKLHAPPSSSSSSSSSSFAAQPEQYPSQITKLPHLSDQRKSYYFTRDLTFHPNSPVKTKISASDEHDLVRAEPPRRSSRRRKSTKRSRVHNRAAPPRPVSSSISAGCSCRATLESVWTKPPESSLNSPTDQTFSSTEHGSTLTEYGSDRGLTPDDVMLTSSACKCRAGDDAVINVDANNHPINGHDEFARVSDFDHRHDLPPIITRKQNHQPQEKHQHRPTPVNAVGERHFSSATVRKASANSSSPGVKLRTNTPKIAKRRGRKSASTETFAVVKSSKDPGRDFRESMVEMIVENNIRASKDLEELLACYLSLNSDEYHELIINVFKQIWFDFIRFRLN